jgi:hypothetical protein
MDVSQLPPGHVDGGGQQPHSFSDASPVSAPVDDDIFKPPQLDGGAQQALDGQAAADTLAPDTLVPTPDTGVQLPPGVGAACPCSGGLICVNNVCRATCAAPTDPCLAKAICPADNACLQTTQGLWVCVPATAQPGQDCTGKWCPVNHVCGAYGLGTPYKCLPTCTGANSPCGTTGGKCVVAQSGCSFCSSL